MLFHSMVRRGWGAGEEPLEAQEMVVSTKDGKVDEPVARKDNDTIS